MVATVTVIIIIIIIINVLIKVTTGDRTCCGPTTTTSKPSQRSQHNAQHNRRSTDILKVRQGIQCLQSYFVIFASFILHVIKYFFLHFNVSVFFHL